MSTEDTNDIPLGAETTGTAGVEDDATPDVAGPGTTAPYRPPHPALRLLAFIASLIAVTVVIGVVAYAVGMRRSADLGNARPIPFMFLAMAVVGGSLLASAVSLRLERRPFGTLGFRPRWSALRDIGLGLFGGALTPAIVALGFLAFGAATIGSVQVDWLGATIPMIVAMVLVSSAEEIQLRGYFMQAIGAMGGPLVASVVSGVVFGLLHAGNPGANPAGVAITAINGILLALLAARTGSLWLVCGYHAGWNVVAAIGFGMRDSGMSSPGGLASTELHGSAFWTGGSYGFEASIVTFVVEAIILVLLLKVAPRVAYDPGAQPYYEMEQRPEAPTPPATVPQA